MLNEFVIGAINMNDNICIIIQGPSDDIERHKKCWNDYHYIFSSWIDDKKISNNPCILSLKPKELGSGNINLQKISTLNGLYIAKNLGFDYCLKIRSDMYPTNTKLLIKSFNFDKINFIAKHGDIIDGYNGYLVDYLQFGKTNDLIKLWSINNIYYSRVAEICLLNNFEKYFSSSDINFLINNLDDNNDLWWNKNKIFISTYKKDPIYRSIW